MRLLIDVENTFERRENGKLDPSPFGEKNKLVSFGIKDIDTKKILYGFTDNASFVAEANELLAQATEYIGHNLRYDMEWLLECGFKINKNAKLACTQLREYILARGLKMPLSLKACAERRGLSAKLDILNEYIAAGKNVDEVPRPILEEYGIQDLNTCDELYWAQEADYQKKENKGLIPTLTLSQDMTWVVIDLERNGIKIDLEALDQVRQEFTKEFNYLTTKLQDMITISCGSLEVNINSEEQLSNIIYSRVVDDKNKWADTFKLEKNERNKPIRRPAFSKSAFYERIRDQTTLLFKTETATCKACMGNGVTEKYTKHGVLFKKLPSCVECKGRGSTQSKIQRPAEHKRRCVALIERYVSEQTRASFEHTASHPIGGLRCVPEHDVYLVTTGGISTDKDTLALLKTRAENAQNHFAAEFLGAVIRRNALKTYITSFVDGIERNTRRDGLLHTKINQCITSTGRLSSSDPNLQNQPRGRTFPIRKAFVSRFPGGRLLECDFRQLEFRVAGELSGDANIFEDIYNKVDIHSTTARILSDADQPTDRQAAKPHTFKPIYGGMSGTEAEQTYYRAFLERYAGLRDYQVRLQDEAIATKMITLPTGRQYAFPYARRMRHGGSTSSTQIKNYPVQGFATADIVTLAIVRLRRLFIEHDVRSLIINDIHDSITIDVHPGDEQLIIALASEAMVGLYDEMWDRYRYRLQVELEIEGKIGPNALEMEFLFDASSKQFTTRSQQL